jgi:hypothetical protein
MDALGWAAMAVIVFVVIALAALLLVRATSRRVSRILGIHYTRATANALTSAVECDEIDKDTSQFIFDLWWDAITGHTPVPCACGAMSLHCDEDKQDLKGITHTTKFCDVAE